MKNKMPRTLIANWKGATINYLFADFFLLLHPDSAKHGKNASIIFAGISCWWERPIGSDSF
jgi:hypothetical protein